MDENNNDGQFQSPYSSNYGVPTVLTNLKSEFDTLNHIIEKRDDEIYVLRKAMERVRMACAKSKGATGKLVNEILSYDQPDSENIDSNEFGPALGATSAPVASNELSAVSECDSFRVGASKRTSTPSSTLAPRKKRKITEKKESKRKSTGKARK